MSESDTAVGSENPSIIAELGIDAAEDIGGVKQVIMAQEADVKLAGMWATVVAILKTMIGVGILGLPYAMKTGGWLFSIFMFPLIALLTGYCMVALIRAKEAAHLSRTTAPADVGVAGFGEVGRIVMAVVLCVECVGVCFSYFLFITYNMAMITGVKQEIFSVIFFFIFLAFSYIRPVKYIGYMTLVADCLTGIGVIITFIAAFVAAKPSGAPHLFNWKSFPLFLGIVLFAFQAIEMALPAHNMLRNQRRYVPAIVIVLSTACSAYLIFGLAVYLRLADNSLAMITEAIDVYPVQVTVAVLFILSLSVNMECTLYPVYEIADRLSCANRFRYISEKERARLLAVNENVNVEMKEQVNPNPNPNPSPNSSTYTGQSANQEIEIELEEDMDSSSSESAIEPSDAVKESVTQQQQQQQQQQASSRSDLAVVVPPPTAVTTDQRVQTEAQAQAQAEAEAEDEGCFTNFQKNIKFWALSSIARGIVLLFIMIPSLTPVRTHFESFMGLSGSTTGIAMTFILPMLAQLKLQWKTLPMWQKIIDIAIIVVSVPGMVYITVITLLDLIESLKAGM